MCAEHADRASAGVAKAEEMEDFCCKAVAIASDSLQRMGVMRESLEGVGAFYGQLKKEWNF